MLFLSLFSTRMWNLEQNDNYVLSVDGSGFESGEVVNCISYNKVKGKTYKRFAVSSLFCKMAGLLINNCITSHNTKSKSK